MPTHLVWLRNDLRISDQPALQQAMRDSARVVALYIDCPEQWQQHARGARQLEFIQQNLEQLRPALAALDIELYLQRCDTFSDVPGLLREFIQQHQIDALFCNRETGIDEQRRDAMVAQRIDCEMHQSEADCIVPPGRIVTGSGDMYRVFTPFRNAWVAYIQQHGYPVVDSPGDHDEPASRSSSDPLQWPAGEAAARQRLRDFCSTELADYARQRDYPSIDGTSGLSPYLAIGVLSARQCLRELETQLGYLPLSRGENGFAWMNELAWREFYRHLMLAYPRLSMGRAFKTETEQLAWSNDREQFQAWCDGHTGYPIIDAAMRCLRLSGWMHNRLRMLVSSFLVKDLLIDWRWGERYFMSQLIDADFPSNNGGWQWSAGTGADAAPYFRIFNPATQSARYDKQGEFIRRWVPELQAVPDKHIHTPHQWLAQQGMADSYAPPIVDHGEARQRCLKSFQALK